METNRTIGTAGMPLIECINPMRDRWHIRWDVHTEETEDDSNLVNYMEALIEHKPTMDEVRDIINSWINSEVDNRILSGFTWRGYKVWLSSENQFNYKAAYDLAVQTSGATLPVTFKFGDTDNPTYFSFTNMEDAQDFYVSVVSFIQSTLADGWRRKDEFDYSPYEEILTE